MNDKNEALIKLLEISHKIPFFEGLEKVEIVKLLTDVKILNYKNKQNIFQEGEVKRNYVFYLLQGKIAISKNSSSTGTKTRLATINEPSLFGEMMRLTGEPRSATVDSAEDNTLVLAFKILEFKEVTPVSKFYKNVIRELSNKINNMNEKAT